MALLVVMAWLVFTLSTSRLQFAVLRRHTVTQSTLQLRSDMQQGSLQIAVTLHGLTGQFEKVHRALEVCATRPAEQQ